MPIYLYQCQSCGVRFERLQRMTEDPVTECPECGGETHRVIQPVGIIFKGSGFYSTDNRRGSSPTLAPPKAKSEEKGASESGETEKAATSHGEEVTRGDSAKAKELPREKDAS
jgi:putative FmdB family regulatory protein